MVMRLSFLSEQQKEKQKRKSGNPLLAEGVEINFPINSSGHHGISLIISHFPCGPAGVSQPSLSSLEFHVKSLIVPHPKAPICYHDSFMGMKVLMRQGEQFQSCRKY